MTEIRVNDLNAIISVDGIQNKTNELSVNCKSTAQKVVITAPQLKAFTRMVPSASEFSPDDSFWNVSLESNDKFNLIGSQTHDSPDLSVEIVLLRKKLSALEKNLTDFQNSSLAIAASKPQAASSSQVEKQGLKMAHSQALLELQDQNKSLQKTDVEFVAPTPAIVSPPSLLADKVPATELKEKMERESASVDQFQLEHMNGTFIQIEAVHGLHTERRMAERRLSSLREYLLGKQITICPTHIPSLSQHWTKILVGPVNNKYEADKLAKKIGQNSFSIASPKCETHLKSSFLLVAN